MPDLYDGPAVASEDVVSVYVVLNGSLGMSPGKAAAQAFHAGWLLREGGHFPAWEAQGRRVVVRVAETQHLFDRVKAECRGTVQRDEGMQEVERGAETAFVTQPYLRSATPKILTHKKIQLYTGEL